MRVTQPVGVVGLTNVAMIKYKTNNYKFEIACYKNKAINWRNGVEKDIREVLQIYEIYTNATKGDVASREDLAMCFGQEVNKDQMIKIILEKGDLQVSEKERDVYLENAHADIVKFIQEKCVHSVSDKQLTPQSIQHAISKVSFVIKPDQNVKRQSLQCIKKLKEQFFIKRAAMRVSVGFNGEVERDKIIQILNDLNLKDVTVEANRLFITMDPSFFRLLSAQMTEKLQKQSIDVVEAVVRSKFEGIDDLGAVELEARIERIQVSDSEEDEKPKKQLNKKQQKIQSELKQQQQQIQQLQQQQQQPGVLLGKFKCANCHISFETNQEFREHYKTPWHNYNVRCKSKGKATLSYEDFLEQQLSEDMKK